MTPAAVYYHFASKEQILTEGMQQFARSAPRGDPQLQIPQPGDAGAGAMITHVLAWTIRRRAHATVYFVNSIGLNLVVEAVRREVREEMVDLLRDAVKAVRGRLSGAEAGRDRRHPRVADRNLAGLDPQPGFRVSRARRKKSIAAVAGGGRSVAGLTGTG